MRSFFLHVFTMTLGAALCVAGALYAVEEVETHSLRGVAQALADEALTWAEVHTDGLQVRLDGTAPDEASRFRALSVAGSVVEATRVVDEIEVRPAAATPPPDFALEILRNAEGISLIGLVPAELDRDQLRERIRRIAGTAQVADLLEVADYPRPDGWTTSVNFALEALAALPRAKISATAEAVAITAVTDSPEAMQDLEAQLTEAAPEGIALTLDIAAPRPVITPFTLRFLIEDGTPRFDACSADSVEARAEILAAAARAGLEEAECTLSLGVPTPRWSDAVSAAIATLDRLGGGSVTFSDADISLLAAEGTDPALFDREIGELETALPEVFALHPVLPQAPEPEDPERQDAPEFTATRTEDGKVDLRGRLGSERMRAAAESFAQAQFGMGRVHVATRLDESLPEDWSVRVLAALDALGHLAEGQAHVEAESLSVRGETGNERASDDIARLMAERLGEGAEYDIDVTYVEARDPERAIPTADECATDVRAAAAARKITFAPGSSELEPSAEETLDAIAEVLRECAPLEMEIAGYTDSQGREEMNAALSQQRADAVLTGLMSRRVLTSGLVANGYGEAEPIADNSTEAGREANRRIEFRLIEESESIDEAAPETEGTPGEDSGSAGSPGDPASTRAQGGDVNPGVAPPERGEPL